MRFPCLVAIAFALSGVLACGSSSESPGASDASSVDDSSREDAPTGDANDTGDEHLDGGASSGDANDGGDAGDAETSCAPVAQADGGAAAVCPAEGGPYTGQALVYPCGLPAIADLDAGATADGGWSLDGGHALACMTLCNDITNCYVTPSAAPAVLVTCCP